MLYYGRPQNICARTLGLPFHRIDTFLSQCYNSLCDCAELKQCDILS